MGLVSQPTAPVGMHRKASTPNCCTSLQAEEPAVVLLSTGTAEVQLCAFCNALRPTAAMGSQVPPAFPSTLSHNMLLLNSETDNLKSWVCFFFGIALHPDLCNTMDIAKLLLNPAWASFQCQSEADFRLVFTEEHVENVSTLK